MFGYIRPHRPTLLVGDLDLYQAAYCGLCRTLRMEYGALAPFCLSHDMVFAALVGMSLSPEEPQVEQHRCPYRPTRRQPMLCGHAALSRAADVSLLLLHHKVRDDLADCPALPKRLGGTLLSPLTARLAAKAAKKAPALSQSIDAALSGQAAIEAQGAQRVGLDLACQPSAECVAAVLAALAAEPAQERILYQLGYSLGRFVYLTDALDDLDRDAAAGGFNPFLSPDIAPEERRTLGEEAVKLSISEALLAYSLLTPLRFGRILENLIAQGLAASLARALGKDVKEDLG